MAEYKNGKLYLPNVTLAAMTSVNVRATVLAMKYSMRGIEFGDAVLITHRKPKSLPKNIRYSHTDELTNIDDFNYKMVYELGDHINTDYALIVHADGFVVNPDMWQDAFLDYDYIGAPWPLPPKQDTTTYRDKDGNICRVGNSAGIRSKRLMDFPKKENIPWEGEFAYGKWWFYEDGFICCKIRHRLEAAGMRIAPIEVARYYSHEKMIEETRGIKPFAFHKWEGTNSEYPNFVKEDFWCRTETFVYKVRKRLKKLLKR